MGTQIKASLLSKKQRQLENKLRDEMEKLYEEGKQELEEKAESRLEKLNEVSFVTSNPGAQYTGSFQPIFKATPQEYWGSSYQPVVTASRFKVKLTILCIKKFRTSVLTTTPVDVLRIIFRYLYTYYYKWLAVRDGDYGESKEWRLDKQAICKHYIRPWEQCLCSRLKMVGDTQVTLITNILTQNPSSQIISNTNSL